jgi:hypothetical protein
MTIKYNDIDFDVTDNGDGTFTLAPVGAATAAELVAEYRAVRGETRRAVAFKQKLVAKLATQNAKLQALRAQRDDLKALLEAANAGPDDDEVEAPSE